MTNPRKRTAAKATAKAAPAKVTPAKAAQAKVTPAKAAQAKVTPAKAAQAQAAAAKTTRTKAVPAAAPAKAVRAKAVPKAVRAKAGPAKAVQAKAGSAQAVKAKSPAPRRAVAAGKPAAAGKTVANGARVAQAEATPILSTVEITPPTVDRAGNNGRAAANGAVADSAHAPRAAEPPDDSASVDEPDIWEERVADALAFLRRRITGQYKVDDFGFDPELTDAVFYPLLRLLYRHYFRTECFGVENIPVDGSALVVANHSGTVPVDAMMLSIAMHDETPRQRHLRLLGADLVFRIPVLSEVARKGGTTLACTPDAERLLRTGELVGVFPEGFKGVGKPYRERYRLQRFGRGGFVSAALRTGAPIIPVAIVGAEEIYPIIGSIKPLAKILGLPYLPVTPLFPWLGPLGMLPLPSKWLIEFGEPIPTTKYHGDADDPIVVYNLADQVRETIQHTLHSLLQRRPDPFV